MGVPMSILGKLGVPGVKSLSTDQIYDKFFSKKDIKNFEQFHVAFIDLCKDFNAIMPGKHYNLPPYKEIEELYDALQKKNDEDKKEMIIKFMKERVKESKTDDSAMIVVGAVVPSTAIVLKRTSEYTPLKNFKLHLIPNVVFVPTCTLLALVGVRALEINKTSKP